MTAQRPLRIVVMGIMTRHPVGGVVWQTLHYLLGFRMLGHDVWYVEDGGHQPSSLLVNGGGAEAGDRSREAAAFLQATLSRYDMDDRWAFHARHSDGRCYGISEPRLQRLYREADLIINLHGAAVPTEQHTATNRLVYLETDPVWIQVELHRNLQQTIDHLAPHRKFFTFGENYGRDGCLLPVSERFEFLPTRQPVVLDLWEPLQAPPACVYTTVGNWKQTARDVQLNGEVYRWSKHHEFLKFLDLPQRSGRHFELALSPRGRAPADVRRLTDAGWRVRDSLEFSGDADAYRAYIRNSRGEFTVAKDQNVRLRTGWFSDRSATYLAAGRPVVTQDTGFGDNIPTGEGLFAFATMDDIITALDRIEADPAHHARRARDIARSYFAHDVVLPPLIEQALA